VAEKAIAAAKGEGPPQDQHACVPGAAFGVPKCAGCSSIRTLIEASSFYNARRPHSSLDRQKPDEAYFNALSSIPMAA